MREGEREAGVLLLTGEAADNVVPLRRTWPDGSGDAAEHYVISMLGFNSIPAAKMPDDWPGYDLVAQPPDGAQPLRVSVKFQRLIADLLDAAARPPAVSRCLRASSVASFRWRQKTEDWQAIANSLPRSRYIGWAIHTAASASDCEIGIWRLSSAQLTYENRSDYRGAVSYSERDLAVGRDRGGRPIGCNKGGQPHLLGESPRPCLSAPSA
jgi:hypothetical protein